MDTVELTVPELGPATDRAVVVRWAKGTGERVTVDEPICRLAVGDLEFEVHSTVDGELTRIHAEEGANVLENSSLAEVAVDADAGDEPSAPGGNEAPADAGEAEAPKEKIVTIQPEPIDPEFAPPDPDPGAPDAAAPTGEPPPAAPEPDLPPVDPEPTPPAEPEPPAPEAVPPSEPSPPVETPPAAVEPQDMPADQLPTGDDVDWSGWISPVVQMLADEHGINLAEVRGTGIGGRIRKRDVLRHAESRGPADDA